MRYIVLVGDGMSDRPLEELNGRTPLEVAEIPCMDEIAKRGRVGLVNTIPKGMSPASDVANLSIIGYDPKKFYTGRAPLEAANMGIELKENEVAFRCNLITESDGKIVDYSAGHISTKEAKILIEELDKTLGTRNIDFYPGISYRHLMVLKVDQPEETDSFSRIKCTPPHDIMNKDIAKYLPKGQGSEILIKLIKRSKGILENHDINRVRIDLGENPANMIWLWGQGPKPNIPTFRELYGVEGSIISAVDLINGIGKTIGLEVVNVPGATGYYDTNFKGKGEYGLKALKEKDFLFIHVEAPDEAGHNADIRAKITAIENFDRFVVGTIWEEYKSRGDFRILVLPDHATPISVRTHTSEAVPFVICGADIKSDSIQVFTERSAKASEFFVKDGYMLMKYLIKGNL